MEVNIPEDYDLMESIQQNIDMIAKMSGKEIKAAYLANILAALIMTKVEDKITKRLLKDPTGKTLNKYNKNMSPLNVWGIVVHNKKDKTILGLLQPEVSKSLKKTSGRILKDTIKGIHYPLSTGAKINWAEMMQHVRVMTLRLPLRSAKINKIREGLIDWEKIDSNERSKIINYTFHYLIQNDKHSPMIMRLRAASNSNLLHANTPEIIKLHEEGDGGGTGAGAVGGAVAAHSGTHAGQTASTSTASSTSSGNSAFVPFRLFKNKLVKRIKRNWKAAPKWTRVKTKKKKRKTK